MIVSAIADDGTSGMQSFDINVDSGGYQPYAETTLGEGTYTVELRAVDKAGHESLVSQSFSVDTTPPQLDLGGSGTFCPRCGDRLPLSYEIQDALSGISQWTLSTGGTVIATNIAAETGSVDWDGSGLEGGTHTLMLSARDAAGNEFSGQHHSCPEHAATRADRCRADYPAPCAHSDPATGAACCCADC